MLQVNDIKVDFWHHPYAMGMRSDHTVKGVTTCVITQAKIGKIYLGYSYCSESDQFDRSKGRKIALARALSDFDKETRKVIWEAYWKVVHKDVR